MRQRWLLVVLVLSLAVNAGVLGYIGVKKYQDWRSFERYWRSNMKSRAAGRKALHMLEALDAKRKPAGDAYWEARRRLGELGLEPHPDSASVESTLNRLAWSRRVNESLLADWGREFNRLFAPKQLQRYSLMVRATLDSVRQVDSARRGGGR